MSCPNAAFCLFAFHCVNGKKRPVSISLPVSGYDTVPTLVGIFHIWNCFLQYLDVSSSVNDRAISLVMKEKNRKTLSGIFESGHQDVHTAVCGATSAQPPCLHAVIRLPHLAPVASRILAAPLPTAHTLPYIWRALTWSPRWRSIQPLLRNMLNKRT